MVFGLNNQSIFFKMAVYCILVPRKQMYIFLGRTAKQQQYGKPCGNYYMSCFLNHQYIAVGKLCYKDIESQTKRSYGTIQKKVNIAIYHG